MKVTQQKLTAEQATIGKAKAIFDFSGKDLFVGIDVHKIRWQVAVFYQGLILGNVSIEASSEKLITHLNKYYQGANFNCVYESCAWGFHLCRALQQAGIKCIVVNPADIPGTDKDRKSKTDKIDARKLAMHLAAGLLQPIHIPTEKLQKQSSLIRLRKRLWSDLVRAKNRLKGALIFQGYTIPTEPDKRNWSMALLTWVRQVASRDEDLKDTLLVMLEEILVLKALILKTEKKLREFMNSEAFDRQSKLLRSIPGIGPLSAMLFLMEIGDVRRFKSFDALNRYIGFCPDCYSSGEKQKLSGLSARKHNQLRSALIEASWQLIRRDPAMLNHYRHLQKRMKGQEAIVRIARKLLRRMRAVLLSEKPYVKGMDGSGIINEFPLADPALS